jgi:uncharacterized membrane protein
MKRPISTHFNLFHWFQKNYILIFITILFLYLLFAFMAPILMHLGYDRTSNMIYRAYRSLCHQFAHRSWFLFGEQNFYPLRALNSNSINTLTDAFGRNAFELNISRSIIGNPTTGYKVAICQRDVMIYFSLMIFSIIYIVFKKRIRKIPFIFWVIFAILPMAIDGSWQLLTTFKLFNLPNHESTPLIRSITGALFGFFSGWYLLPSAMEAFNDVNNEKLSR